MKLKSTKYKQLLLVLIIIKISIILIQWIIFRSSTTEGFCQKQPSIAILTMLTFKCQNSVHLKTVSTEWCIRICTGKWFPSIFSLKPTVKECKMQDNVEISHTFSMKNLEFFLIANYLYEIHRTWIFFLLKMKSFQF